MILISQFHAPHNYSVIVPCVILKTPEWNAAPVNSFNPLDNSKTIKKQFFITNIFKKVLSKGTIQIFEYSHLFWFYFLKQNDQSQ